MNNIQVSKLDSELRESPAGFRKMPTMKESKNRLPLQASSSQFKPNSKLGIGARASGKGSVGGGMRAAEMISFQDEVMLSSTVIDPSFNYVNLKTPTLGLPS